MIHAPCPDVNNQSFAICKYCRCALTYRSVDPRWEQSLIYFYGPTVRKLNLWQTAYVHFNWWFLCSHIVPFYNCQISWLTSISFPIVFLVLQSEVTEQQRPRGYISASITFQWKLPVSYSGPLWWIELQSGAADCVLICSTCSLWRLLGRAARSIKQT